MSRELLGPVRVDPWWWEEVRDAVAHLDLPSVVVDAVVMERAQRYPVGQIGGSAVRPPPEMVRLGIARRVIAAGEGAAAVLFGECLPLGGTEQPSCPAEVEDFTGTAEDGGDDVRLCGEKPGGGGGDARVDTVDLRQTTLLLPSIRAQPRRSTSWSRVIRTTIVTAGWSPPGRSQVTA